MKPLKTTRQMLVWLGINHEMGDEKVNIRQKIIYAIVSSILITAMAVALCASIGYFFKWASVDLPESLYAVFQIAACSAINFQVVSAYYLRRQFTDIINKLSKIYDSSKEIF